MIWLSHFTFPDEDAEWDFRMSVKETYHQSIYPFYVLPQKGLQEIFFRPLTIIYGGNGSGKSTVLNVVAEALGLKRESPYNRSCFFDNYVEMCRFSLDEDLPEDSRIITSDDVFNYMLNIRAVNEGIDQDRARLAEEYGKLKRERFRMQSMDDYDHLRQIVDARRKTLSRFIAGETQNSVCEQSNGESALMYFQSRIQDDTFCLLDEPENSLSPSNQVQLADFLADSVRYCGCQLVISTHSPFLLAIPGARIIDLDHGSQIVNSWV